MTKEELLVSYIEKWLKNGRRRNIQKLSRQSGIPYPTIRRIVQRDSSPNLETALAILNVVATVPEAMEYLTDTECVHRFFKRFVDYSSTSTKEFKAHIVDRESFWILMLGLTMGASRAQIRNLLGSFGLATLERLIEEGVMVEQAPDIFVPRIQDRFMYVEDRKLAHEVVGYIHDLPCEEEPLQRFLVCNVNREGFEALRRVLTEAFHQCQSIAQQFEGNQLAALNFVGKRVGLVLP